MNDMYVETISADQRATLRPEWQRLAATTPSISLFGSPLWVENYARHRRQAGQVAIGLAARTPDGQFAGLALLAREGLADRHLPALRVVHATGEYLSEWVCAPQDAAEFVSLLYDKLSEMDRRWFQLKVNGLREDSPILAAWRSLCIRRRLPFEERRGTIVPYVRVDIPTEQAQGLCSGKYRRELARKRRELEKLGPIEFIDTRDPGPDLEQQFKAFMAVEASGWKGREGGAIACQPDAQDFWWALVKEAAETGNLRLCLLTCGDKPVAGQLGVTWQDTYYCLRVGYDEQYRRHGPGALLTQYALHQCVEDTDLKIYDFAGAAQPYMSNWTASAYESRSLFIGRPEALPAAAFRALLGTRAILASLRRKLQKHTAETADARPTE